jgi:hypothetical protein
MATVMAPNPTGSKAFLKPIIQDSTTKTNHSIQFDLDKHLEYESPSKVFTMKDIDLPEDIGISPVAASEPFSLFSKDAVEAFRQEIFADDVWKNCAKTSDLAACQLRGHAPK